MTMLNNNGLILILVLSVIGSACAGPVKGEAPQDVSGHWVADPDGIRLEPWVQGLEVPWSPVFLPDSRALVSERPGRIRLIRDGRLAAAPYAELDVHHSGEGGLMGLALHPDFPNAPYIYAMHTYREGRQVYNRVVRLKDEGDRARLDRVLIDKIPGGRFHNGGRIAFGPDGMLYITTGETFQGSLAQDLNSLGGKILRLTPDGGIPADNPFGQSPIYSYGHRNPQGLVWHPDTGKLYESEHGPSGEYTFGAYDELNIIEAGGNYGWPEVVGAPGIEPYRDPIVAWPDTTMPPAGMTFFQGDLFVATLDSQTLVRVQVADDGRTVAGLEYWFAEAPARGRLGRLRDAVVGSDGALYLLTSNRDGRGSPRPGDDQIYRLSLVE